MNNLVSNSIWTCVRPNVTVRWLVVLLCPHEILCWNVIIRWLVLLLHTLDPISKCHRWLVLLFQTYVMLYSNLNLKTGCSNWHFSPNVFLFISIHKSSCSALCCLRYWQLQSINPLACTECGDSLPFSGASSIPPCHTLFPATTLHRPFFHPPSLHPAICFLVYLLVLLFPNMQLYTVYLYLQTALHVLGGISTHYQELISLCLQYLALMSPLLLPVMSHPVMFTTDSSNGLINARYCRYNDMSAWWWVEIPPETCRAVYRYK